jgi:threonine/homoserine/homoserine lactone efflux protein
VTSFWMGALAGYGIAIPVGAIAVLIVQVGMRCGFTCAVSAGAGAASADLAYSVLAVTGGAALAGAVESFGRPFRWASAGVLIVLAARGLYSIRGSPTNVQATLPGRREYAGAYAKFFGLTVINPLTVVYFAAFVLGLGVVEDLSAAEGILFVAGVFLASLSWQTFLAGIGALARRKLPRRFQVAAVVVGNLIVMAIAALIIIR